MTLKIALVLIAPILLGAASPPEMNQDMNVAAFGNGALIESPTPAYQGWESSYLLDESALKGWADPKGAKPPFTTVISLAERSTINTLVFDTAHVDRPDRAAKDVEVAVSDISATAGFTSVLSVSLGVADGQSFPLKLPATGRWIRLTVKSNHGAEDYYELMDFRAFGRQLTQTVLPSGLSGTYSTALYGKFHLLQKGAELTGCYEWRDGLIQGGLESHLMRLTWTQTDGSGPAVMVLKRDGKGFVGWWRHASGGDWNNDWDLKKISDKVGRCAKWNGTSSVIASELSANGRSRLYGINFDTDSAHLRADAKPEADELIGVLKTHPDWRVSIDGHTDSTGSVEHNLDLSKRRAASVMSALVAGGVAADRMTAEGFGQSKPLAGNDTEIGRAQNRRVEVVRK